MLVHVGGGPASQGKGDIGTAKCDGSLKLDVRTRVKPVSRALDPFSRGLTPPSAHPPWPCTRTS